MHHQGHRHKEYCMLEKKQKKQNNHKYPFD